MATKATLNWAAGFFDGEGSITLTSKDGHMRLEVACSQKVQYPLDLFERTFNGSVYSSTPPRGEVCYIWKIYGARAVAFLQELSPYMIVKQQDARDVIDIWLSQDHARAIKRHEDRRAVKQRTHDIRAGNITEGD